MSLRFVALDEAIAAHYRRAGPDANGQVPERRVAQAGVLPCRHCLDMIRAGEAYLTLAHRPFPAPQPYAETGPIFLHAESCPRGGGTAEIPVFLASPAYIVRGYGWDDRIAYGTGGVVETTAIAARAAELLADPAIAYLHVRSASNNCYHCRIERAGGAALAAGAGQPISRV